MCSLVDSDLALTQNLPDTSVSMPMGCISLTQVINKAICGLVDEVSLESESRYKPPLDPDKLELLSRKTFSVNTNSKINWAVNLYCDWYFQRCKSTACNSCIKWSNLDSREISPSNLAYSLSCSSEVRLPRRFFVPIVDLYSVPSPAHW